ncbi:unnamed protein product [Phytophthora fragariaefolia]|uniref:Unnamed protein product n=1 Tax=Phytophthora fragariaefolia TaxID=1490495 RepID=A0A9W6XCS5_9STRA|nr:unnamed protein product [Phytophthora fragariaefolia]
MPSQRHFAFYRVTANRFATMSRVCVFLTFVAIVHVFSTSVTAVKYDIMANYLSDECNSTNPYIVYARQNGGCEDDVCYAFDAREHASTDCSKQDYIQVMRDFFGDAPYIIHTLYSDDDCSTFEYAVGFLATNSCLGGTVTAGLYYQASLSADGVATVIPYYVHIGSMGSMVGDSSCSSTNVTVAMADDDILRNHSCALLADISAAYDYFTNDSVNSVSSYEWYTSNDVGGSQSNASGEASAGDSLTGSSGSVTAENSGDSIDTAAIAGIVVGAVVVAVAIFYALIGRRRKGKNTGTRSNTNNAESSDNGLVVEGQRGLWNDEVITAKRIPRDKVKVKKLIRREPSERYTLGLSIDNKLLSKCF